MQLRREQQELAVAALRSKCDILWAQLDAIYFAYVTPGWPPSGRAYRGCMTAFEGRPL